MLEIEVEMATMDSDCERRGRVCRKRKLDFISECLEAGLNVRVRTIFEPRSRETLMDLGSEIARAGVTKWIIAPKMSSLGTDPEAYGEARDEIRHVLTAFPWMHIDDKVVVHGLVGPDGRPISAGSSSHLSIVTDLRYIDETLMQRLGSDPRHFFDISPREFEEVVAHLLMQRGYEVRLTPTSRDHGKDLYVASKSELGNFLYIVECKRYAPDRPVGVEVIRSLYGVVQAEKVNAGIVATTSYFSKEAREFQSTIQFHMHLHDYYSLQSWIRDVLNPRRTKTQH